MPAASIRKGEWVVLEGARSGRRGDAPVRRRGPWVAPRRTTGTEAPCSSGGTPLAPPPIGTARSAARRATSGTPIRAAPRCGPGRRAARTRAPETPRRPRAPGAPGAGWRGSGSSGSASSSVRSRPAYGLGLSTVARVGAQSPEHPPVVMDRVVALRCLDNLNHPRESRVLHDVPKRSGPHRALADPFMAVEPRPGCPLGIVEVQALEEG